MKDVETLVVKRAMPDPISLDLGLDLPKKLHSSVLARQGCIRLLINPA
jgi:hypothetical protein